MASLRKCGRSVEPGAGCAIADAVSQTDSVAAIASERVMTCIMAVPQRIRLAVVDNIWSAAVMTLPFIS
jgi:hypothetical protein